MKHQNPTVGIGAKFGNIVLEVLSLEICRVTPLCGQFGIGNE